jgi:hypothetical protein
MGCKLLGTWQVGVQDSAWLWRSRVRVFSDPETRECTRHEARGARGTKQQTLDSRVTRAKRRKDAKAKTSKSKTNAAAVLTAGFDAEIIGFWIGRDEARRRGGASRTNPVGLSIAARRDRVGWVGGLS